MKLFGFKFGGDGYAFTITVPNPVEAVAKARNAVEANGGRLDGNEQAGTFSGKGVEGRYEEWSTASQYRKSSGFQDAVFTITITRKPWLVSYGYIERTVRSYFA